MASNRAPITVNIGDLPQIKEALEKLTDERDDAVDQVRRVKIELEHWQTEAKRWRDAIERPQYASPCPICCHGWTATEWLTRRTEVGTNRVVHNSCFALGVERAVFHPLDGRHGNGPTGKEAMASNYTADEIMAMGYEQIMREAGVLGPEPQAEAMVKICRWVAVELATA